MFHSGSTIVVGVAAGFQNVVEADHVGLNIGVRISNGVDERRPVLPDLPQQPVGDLQKFGQ